MSEDVQVRKGDLVGVDGGPLHIVRTVAQNGLIAFCCVTFEAGRNHTLDAYFTGSDHNRERFADRLCGACLKAERPTQWERIDQDLRTEAWAEEFNKAWARKPSKGPDHEGDPEPV